MMCSKSKMGASGLLLIGAACLAWVIYDLGSAPLTETMRVKRVVESRKFQEKFRVVPFSAPELGDTIALRVLPWSDLAREDLPEEALLEMTEYIRVNSKLDRLAAPKLEPFTKVTDTLIEGRRTRIIDQMIRFYRIYPVKR